MSDVLTFMATFDCSRCSAGAREDIANICAHVWDRTPAWLLEKRGIGLLPRPDGGDRWNEMYDRRRDLIENWHDGILGRTHRLGLDIWSREYLDFRSDNPVGPVFEVAATQWTRDEEQSPDWTKDMEDFIRFLPEILDAHGDPGTVSGLLMDLETMECSAFAADRKKCLIERARPERLAEKLGSRPAGPRP